MAREIIIRRSDDFDRTQEADDEIEFVYEGVKYTLDLTTENADEFRTFINQYIEVCQLKAKVRVEEKGAAAGKAPKIQQALLELEGGRTVKAQAKSPAGETTEDRRAIRDWAKANGYDVPERGIIRQSLRDAYTEATGIPTGSNIVTKGEIGTIPEGEAAHIPNSAGVTPAMRAWARKKGYMTAGGYVKAEHRNEYAMEQLGQLNMDAEEVVTASRNGAHV